MDQNRFDAMTRALSTRPSRRSVLGGLAGSMAGLLAARLPGAGAAKRKRRKKKPQPNAFGCLNVGAPCQSAGQCCSGVCTGKKGKKRCRAHDTGNCRVGQSIAFCGGENSGCAVGGGNPTGVCGTSTGNAGYCVGGGDCFPCTRDAECRPFCGPGAACVRCAD